MNNEEFFKLNKLSIMEELEYNIQKASILEEQLKQTNTKIEELQKELLTLAKQVNSAQDPTLVGVYMTMKDGELVFIKNQFGTDRK